MSRSCVAIVWAALRRRPFSFIATILLCSLTAALVGASVPLALLAWLLTGLALVAAWLVVEPVALQGLGCRRPTSSEQERLAAAVLRSPVKALVVDDTTPWVGGGLQTVVISSGVLDFVDDQPLVGLIAQAKLRTDAACLAREALVWLGNLPVVGVWQITALLCQVGRVLAFGVGASLAFPLLLWPTGFVTWVGRLFGWTLVAVLGSMFLSGGLAALGAGMLLGWAVVAGLRVLLAVEARRAGDEADRATLEAGLGPQLVEALETIAWLNAPTPSGWLQVLVRDVAPPYERIERLKRALSQD